MPDRSQDPVRLVGIDNHLPRRPLIEAGRPQCGERAGDVGRQAPVDKLGQCPSGALPQRAVQLRPQLVEEPREEPVMTPFVAGVVANRVTDQGDDAAVLGDGIKDCGDQRLEDDHLQQLHQHRLAGKHLGAHRAQPGEEGSGIVAWRCDSGHSFDLLENVHAGESVVILITVDLVSVHAGLRGNLYPRRLVAIRSAARFTTRISKEVVNCRYW